MTLLSSLNKSLFFYVARFYSADNSDIIFIRVPVSVSVSLKGKLTKLVLAAIESNSEMMKLTKYYIKIYHIEPQRIVPIYIA